MAFKQRHAAADSTVSPPLGPDAPGHGRLAGQHGFSLVETLAVVALIGIITAIAVPVTGSALAGHRFRSDAQSLSNVVALAKMRASAGFTRARVRANLDDSTFVLERWDKTANAWVAEGGVVQMSPGVTFGFADLAAPPPNTQVAIGQSPECLAGIDDDADAIADTACVAFNSRGLPVDGDGALFGGHGLYITDGRTAYAVTVTATPRIRRWWSSTQAANWEEQQ